MQKRETYISLARIISALTVVIIHTNACASEFNVDSCWMSGNLIDGTAVFAVPVFLMITGATLLDYNERYDTKEFLKKRFFKTVIPFLFWFTFAKITGFEIKIWMVFMFFSYLLGTYLAIPLFSFIEKEKKERVVFYVIIVSFLFNYLIPFISNMFNITFFIPTFEIAGGYLIYALVGYLIHRKDVPVRWRIVCYLLSIIGWGMHVWGTYFASLNAGAVVNVYKGYTNLPCLLQSVGIFMLIKEIGNKIKNDKVCVFLEWLSNYTFPVYFLHVYLVNIIPTVINCNTHSLIYRFGAPILNFIICMIITWFVRKIPVLRRILP